MPGWFVAVPPLPSIPPFLTSGKDSSFQKERYATGLGPRFPPERRGPWIEKPGVGKGRQKNGRGVFEYPDILETAGFPPCFADRKSFPSDLPPAIISPFLQTHPVNIRRRNRGPRIVNDGKERPGIKHADGNPSYQVAIYRLPICEKKQFLEMSIGNDLAPYR